MKMRLLFLLAIAFSLHALAQDSSLIRVQFIYGSRPLKKYRREEKKWFGGLLGGHVGIEANGGKFYSFEINGRNKIFGGRPDNSIYKIETADAFWNVMETKEDSLKTATVFIPVSRLQQHTFDSITAAYSAQVPYGYAVFGMRCAASTYDILARLGLFPKYGRFRTWSTIFYPRRLRKRLLAKAKKNHWTVRYKEGTPRRKWEKDVG